MLTGPAELTTPVEGTCADVADDVPSEPLAVTVTRIVEPPSAVVSV